MAINDIIIMTDRAALIKNRGVVLPVGTIVTKQSGDPDRIAFM